MLSELFQSELALPSSMWVLLPFFSGLLFLFYTYYRNREKRAALSLALRCVALVCLALAWADPIKKDSKSSQTLLALVDTSASVNKEGLRAFINSLRNFSTAGEDLSISLFPFGKSVDRDPIILRGAFKSNDIVREIESRNVNRGETDIGAAIQFATSQAPGSAVLLMSDGFETQGNARESARTFAASGGTIYPLLPGDEAFQSQALELSMLQLPLTSKARDLVEVRVTAKNNTAQAVSGKLEVLLDDKPILAQKIDVRPNEERLVSANTPPLEGGLKKIIARLTPSGGTPQELHRWVSVRNKARLILLSGGEEDQRVLKPLLALKGYTVEAITLDRGGELPQNLDDCSGLIFNNVSKQQVTPAFLNQIKSFAEKGGGVLLVGGDKSFGLGGYIDTPIEEISPLKFVPPKTTKRRILKGIAIVIDKSRSMAYDGKIEGARDAALLAIQSLKDEDFVSVIGFDATAFVVIRMAPVAEVRQNAAYRLGNLVAMGKTDLLPAMIEARRALTKAPTDRKHMIVLSDGKIPISGDEYLEELSKLKQAGISLSAVALGDDADAPFMQMLSQYGKGHFYQTLSSSKLPDIFINDIKVSTGEKTIKERSDFPVGIGPSGIRSTSIDRFPYLVGYVETLPKRGADIELITKSNDAVSPLLASWKFGAGNVVAFTSDANGRWSLPWLNWEGFARFWTDLIEKVEHAPDENSSQVEFDLRTSVNRGAIYFDLSVFDEKLRTGAAPRIAAEITIPGGEKRNISFLAEKKGRFKGVLEGARPGEYKIQVLYGKQKLPLVGLSLDGNLFGEAAGRGLNRGNLSELASITSGVVNPLPSQVTLSKKISESTSHLFPPLIILAFILLVLEVFLRELGVGAIQAMLKSLVMKDQIVNNRIKPRLKRQGI